MGKTTCPSDAYFNNLPTFALLEELLNGKYDDTVVCVVILFCLVHYMHQMQCIMLKKVFIIYWKTNRLEETKKNDIR